MEGKETADYFAIPLTFKRMGSGKRRTTKEAYNSVVNQVALLRTGKTAKIENRGHPGMGNNNSFQAPGNGKNVATNGGGIKKYFRKTALGPEKVQDVVRRINRGKNNEKV